MGYGLHACRCVPAILPFASTTPLTHSPQLISSAERAARQAFYTQHGIGSGFVRPSRFKKMSNMNYSLVLSLKVERFVLQLVQERERRCMEASASNITSTNSHSNLGLHVTLNASNDPARMGTGLSMVTADKDDIKERALQLVLEETGHKWKPWAANRRAICVGKIVLIVDSDTIVPEDCFRDTVRELAESPECAIIQHESGEAFDTALFFVGVGLIDGV